MQTSLKWEKVSGLIERLCVSQWPQENKGDDFDHIFSFSSTLNTFLVDWKQSWQKQKNLYWTASVWLERIEKVWSPRNDRCMNRNEQGTSSFCAQTRWTKSERIKPTYLNLAVPKLLQTRQGVPAGPSCRYPTSWLLQGQRSLTAPVHSSVQHPQCSRNIPCADLRVPRASQSCMQSQTEFNGLQARLCFNKCGGV